MKILSLSTKDQVVFKRFFLRGEFPFEFSFHESRQSISIKVKCYACSAFLLEFCLGFFFENYLRIYLRLLFSRKMFCVAEEAIDSGNGPVVIVNGNWLTPRKTRCFWPSKTVKNYNKALISGEEPDENWKIIQLNRILYETGSHFTSCNIGIYDWRSSSILMGKIFF